MNNSIVVTGVGMITPVGLNAINCFFSVRAGITRLQIEEFPDRTRQWITGARIMTGMPYIRENRMRILARLAIQECWEQANKGQASCIGGPVALLIGLPESIRPGFEFPQNPIDHQYLLQSFAVDSRGPIETFRGGHCNGQLGLEKAVQYLTSGEVSSCIVGAVDTQLQLKVIRWHEDHCRLKCAYMNDGLIPGEAATFLVIESEKYAKKRGATALAKILSVSTDREDATILSDQPNTAKGLTNAVRFALNDARVSAESVESVWCDLNGESYRAREWAFTEVRLGFENHTELRHPADCYGDLGAVSDMTLLGLSALSQASGWSYSNPSLVFAGSEGGIRAATLLGPVEKEKNLESVFQISEGMPRTFTPDIDLPPLGPDDMNYEETDNPPRSYFEWKLRQEHLDEIASLFYQREALLRDPEIEWTRVHEPEQRILNHLDAVITAGSSSIWAVGSGILNDEEGVCFAGGLTLGSISTTSVLRKIDETLNDITQTNVKGIRAALKYVRNTALLQFLEKWLTHYESVVRATAAFLIGYRREGTPHNLIPLLESNEEIVQQEVIHALRRFRHFPALPKLERLFESESSSIRYASLLSALALGSTSAQSYCRSFHQSGLQSESYISFLLAIAGNGDDFSVLAPKRERYFSTIGHIEAAGVLGNVKAIPILIDTLQSGGEELKVPAGAALERILGAGLTEKAIIEKNSEDEGEGDEEIEFAQVERASTSYEKWVQWWQRNHLKFVQNTRWVGGKPFSLGLLIDEVSCETALFSDRERAYLELVIRSGHDIPFEPDWFVPNQKAAISKWKIWWKQNEGRFQPGKWYFNGQIV